MNSISKATMRFASFVTKTPTTVLKNAVGKRDFTRTLWHMSKQPESSSGQATVLKVHKPGMMCSCGCGQKGVHTKGERELAEFLVEEIDVERKTQKGKTVPNTLSGFAIQTDGSDMELTKKCGDETIIISLNVNHSVDSDRDAEPEAETNESNVEKHDMCAMRSKPRFEVDIIKGKTTLSFTCSYLDEAPQEGEYDDIFGIDELMIYEGEWNDKVYAVAGDVLDGYLYDLLMNLLEEKGVNNEFVENLSDLATTFEHASYVKFLENLSKFNGGK